MPGMIEENPELVQPENWARMKSWTGKTPVFLFHDGGGTTFAYHCLDPVKRFVYGIRNPYFFNGKRFEGIPEMAAQYIKWVKDAVLAADFPAKPPGGDRRPQQPVDILIGGWSLGGMTSLEVARQLAGDPDVRVKGILMIDSVYPGRLSEIAQDDEAEEQQEDSQTAAEAAPTTQLDPWEQEEEAGKTKNQILSIRAMREARRMVAKWDVPRWEGPLAGQRPPAFLIRARDSLYAQDWSKSLDASRGDNFLGWADYDEKMFVDAVEVDGHHFNMFDHSRIPGITAAITKALLRLDPPPSSDSVDSWDLGQF